jgi:hypothetical protein
VRLRSRVAGIALAVLVAAGAAVWQLAFQTPSVSLLALPAGLVAIDSPSGKETLAASRFVADYEKLTSNFVSQSRRAFCGVATAVILINALRGDGPRVTQQSFFTAQARKIRGPLRVTFTGMSLGEIGDLLRAHRVKPTIYYASDTTIDAFRSVARNNLRTAGNFILVNYERAELGQEKVGHISPLAAYDAKTDRFLILDVAAYKYPPVWVSTAMLWNAMHTIDSSSGRTRGFLEVREGT